MPHNRSVLGKWYLKYQNKDLLIEKLSLMVNKFVRIPVVHRTCKVNYDNYSKRSL